MAAETDAEERAAQAMAEAAALRAERDALAEAHAVAVRERDEARARAEATALAFQSEYAALSAAHAAIEAARRRVLSEAVALRAEVARLGGTTAEAAEAGQTPFDPAWYLHAYPDVAAAVDARIFGSALEHYILHGRAEGRFPTPPR